MDRVRRWYVLLSQREQRLILVALGLAVIAVVWLAVLLTVNIAQSARTRHADAVERLADTQARVKAIAVLHSVRVAEMAAPIDAVVREQAASAGFVLSGLTPQPDGSVAITISSARPTALFGWSTKLEERGLIITRFATTDNGDRTLAVQMTLKKRGR